MNSGKLPNLSEGFVIPSFFLSPIGIASILIVVLSASNLLFYNLWQGKVDELANFKSTVEAETNRLEEEARRVRAESDQITKDVSIIWGRALDDIRRNPAIRVRSDCNPANLRPLPSSAIGATFPSAEQRFDPIEVPVAECEKRLNWAVEDAMMLKMLQDWTIKQHGIKP